MKRSDFLKKKFDCRRCTELPLNEEANPRIQLTGAVHVQVLGNPVSCPNVSFSQTAVVKAAEIVEQMVYVRFRNEMVPSHGAVKLPSETDRCRGPLAGLR